MIEEELDEAFGGFEVELVGESFSRLEREIDFSSGGDGNVSFVV